jgi:hypothetical protein
METFVIRSRKTGAELYKVEKEDRDDALYAYVAAVGGSLNRNTIEVIAERDIEKTPIVNRAEYVNKISQSGMRLTQICTKDPMLNYSRIYSFLHGGVLLTADELRALDEALNGSLSVTASRRCDQVLIDISNHALSDEYLAKLKSAIDAEFTKRNPAEALNAALLQVLFAHESLTDAQATELYNAANDRLATLEREKESANVPKPKNPRKQRNNARICVTK